jgi:hypothetical protein
MSEKTLSFQDITIPLMLTTMSFFFWGGGGGGGGESPFISFLMHLAPYDPPPKKKMYMYLSIAMPVMVRVETNVIQTGPMADK